MRGGRKCSRLQHTSSVDSQLHCRKCRIRAVNGVRGSLLAGGQQQATTSLQTHSRSPIYQASRQQHKLSIGSQQLRQHFASQQHLPQYEQQG